MLTIDGTPIFPDNDNAPSLYSIGWGLARTGRFAGQTRIWYPVLPHVYTVSALVSEENKIHALLHDAAESVVGDQVATWKNGLTAESEDIILGRIYAELQLEGPSAEAWEEVHKADIAARSAEAMLLGHAAPNHAHFAQIREEFPDLFAQAVDETRQRIAIFTSQYCIEETAKLAIAFQGAVIHQLEKVVV